MLTKRVIPCLDVKDGRVVKGVNFVELRDAGDPVELAAAYDREGADEIVFLDITATSDDRKTTIDLASHAAAELRVPYTVGGGFRDVAGMRQMVAAGADKVSVNSAAVKDPSLITAAASAFGSQAVICAIDARQTGPNKWEVYVAGGRTATHQGRIRYPADPRGGACRQHPCDRVGRRGYARALRRGHHRRRGGCGAGRERLPLRHLHDPPGQGVHG